MTTTSANCPYRRPPWHRRAGQRLRHSIKLRMVVVFLLLAAAMTFVFISGVQKALSIGWRDAARPLLVDYVDHLVADISDSDGTPNLAKANALAQRLPVTIRIKGPQIDWSSHPDQIKRDWNSPDEAADSSDFKSKSGAEWRRLVQRTTASGHTVVLGIDDHTFERRPRMVGYTLVGLLLLTLFTWLYVRRLLKPLDDIGAGARRFGSGDFSQPIAVRRPHHCDELGQLAQTINAMGSDIHQMLEAKRALLLAISHELRSPLTRARLHAELLPESADTQTQRDSLLRDLHEMSRLITDLLESERLASGHAALQREPTDVAALARDVLAEAAQRQATECNHTAAPVRLLVPPTGLPAILLDPTRTRLLLRNLIDNASRHAAGAAQPTEVHMGIRTDASNIPMLVITVRDHGPGVPQAQLAQLAQAFVRPDSARTRTSGGVGLGLYLCRLVAQAHGGTLTLRNAQPGLEVTATWPTTTGA